MAVPENKLDISSTFEVSQVFKSNLVNPFIKLNMPDISLTLLVSIFFVSINSNLELENSLLLFSGK